MQIRDKIEIKGLRSPVHLSITKSWTQRPRNPRDRGYRASFAKAHGDDGDDGADDADADDAAEAADDDVDVPSHVKT